METKNKNYIKWISLTCLYAALIAFASVIFQPAVLILPILLSVVWVMKGKAAALIPYALFVLVSFFLGGIILCMLLVLLTIPTVISTPLLLKKKRRMYESVLIGSVVSLLGCLLFIGIVYILTGQSVVSLMLVQLEAVLDSNEIVTKQFYIYLSAQPSISDLTNLSSILDKVDADELEKMKSYVVGFFEEALPITIPIGILIFSLINGFASFYFSHKALRKRGADIIKVDRFEDLAVPRVAAIALGLMLLASFVLSEFEVSLFNNVFAALMAVFVLVFSIQGYAFLIYFYKSKRLSLFLCVVLIVVGTLIGIIFWLGFFETFFRFRKRIGNNEGSINRSV